MTRGHVAAFLVVAALGACGGDGCACDCSWQDEISAGLCPDCPAMAAEAERFLKADPRALAACGGSIRAVAAAEVLGLPDSQPRTTTDGESVVALGVVITCAATTLRGSVILRETGPGAYAALGATVSLAAAESITVGRVPDLAPIESGGDWD